MPCEYPLDPFLPWLIKPFLDYTDPEGQEDLVMHSRGVVDSVEICIRETEGKTKAKGL